MKFLWILTAIGSVLGGILLLVGFFEDSAPKQAAAAATAAAMAVIPYCLARASERGAMFDLYALLSTNLKAVRETLETHTRLLAAMANSVSDKTNETNNTSSASR
jgi:Na+/melibiose symporter-like transporter